MAAAPGLSGWVVALAGTGINLALGVLYSWSVISKQIPESWGWSEADRALPYSVACLFFALMMVPAGRLQDKIGPRWVAMAGGVLVGAGLRSGSLKRLRLPSKTSLFALLAPRFPAWEHGKNLTPIPDHSPKPLTLGATPPKPRTLRYIPTQSKTKSETETQGPFEQGRIFPNMSLR